MGTFKEFYTKFGLVDYPFAVYTSENEDEKFTTTFIHPSDYDIIFENFSQKNSIILTGDRGTGKTALIKDFILKLEGPNSLIIQIYDFASLPNNYTASDFYKFLIVQISTDLFSSLADKTPRITQLNYEEKLLVSYLLKNFVPHFSKRWIKERIEKIQLSRLRRFYKKIESYVRPLINYGATVGGNIIEEYIANHFKGLPPLTETMRIKEFFPELPVSIETEFIEQEPAHQLLIKLLQVIKKLQFDAIVVIFDKVDEDQRFDNDAEAIANFIVPILTNNKLLLEKDLQIVFSSWITPFNFIKHKVRTNKHYCPTLLWRHEDLIKALNRRLEAFSGGNIRDYKVLFDAPVTAEQIEQIFYLSNKNPRDLWHIFDRLFRTQFELPEYNKLQRDTIPKALNNFVTLFNYYEYYPRSSNPDNNEMDIYSFAKYLLLLESEVFTRNQLIEKAQTGELTDSYLVSMERIGLISFDSQNGDIVNYRINDPKIVFALKNKLEIKRG